MERERCGGYDLTVLLSALSPRVGGPVGCGRVRAMLVRVKAPARLPRHIQKCRPPRHNPGVPLKWPPWPLRYSRPEQRQRLGEARCPSLSRELPRAPQVHVCGHG